MELSDSRHPHGFRSLKKVKAQFQFHAALHHLNKKTATRREVQHFQTMKRTKLLVQSGVLIQFEPYASNSSSEEEDENANENRLQYTTWWDNIGKLPPLSPRSCYMNSLDLHDPFIDIYFQFRFCYKMLESWRQQWKHQCVV